MRLGELTLRCSEAVLRGGMLPGGGGQKQNASIAERREKDILVGKIRELYAAKGDDPPFGLASSDLATLRRHLERMRDRK